MAGASSITTMRAVAMRVSRVGRPHAVYRFAPSCESERETVDQILSLIGDLDPLLAGLLPQGVPQGVVQRLAVRLGLLLQLLLDVYLALLAQIDDLLLDRLPVLGLLLQ